MNGGSAAAGGVKGASDATPSAGATPASRATSATAAGPGAAHPSPFDALAPSYDRDFTDGLLGRLLRERVWRHLERAFAPGTQVLDVGCGTGEDALHLASRGVRVLATDASAEMVARARARVEAAGADARVDVRRVRAEALLGSVADAAPFGGVLSDFGVLNCVAEPAVVAEQLASLTAPGAPVFLCVMGPLVPWEWGWYLTRGEPRRAFRRLAPRGVDWRGLRVRYPTPRAVRQAFAPSFRAVRLRALGALLPPPYAEAWARRRPQLVARLARAEARLEALPPLPWLADHYLLELVRR